ncbi:MAG: hypothetical protein ABIO79_00200 [Ferruginibacter sp.]
MIKGIYKPVTIVHFVSHTCKIFEPKTLTESLIPNFFHQNTRTAK